MNIYKTIKKPLLTEKGSMLKEKDNKYVFIVDKNATKSDIKNSIEKLFNVVVLAVNIVSLHGKVRKIGFRSYGKYGKRADLKKAYVKIKKDQKIESLEA